MRVRFRGENAQDVVVLVHGLAVVAALDRVPPVGVRIAELALYRERGSEGGVGVVAVLWESISMAFGGGIERKAGAQNESLLRQSLYTAVLTIFGSSSPARSSLACSACSALFVSSAGLLVAGGAEA